MDQPTFGRIGGLEVEYSPGTKHGECEICGKKFMRRQIDAFDDGRLCSDCYAKSKEER